jgi:hypothetical protein
MLAERQSLLKLWSALLGLVALVLCSYQSVSAQGNARGHILSTRSTSGLSDAAWKRMLPEVRKILKEGGFEDVVRLSDEPILLKTGLITGDGITAALIELGGLGASTEGATLIRIEHGKPVLARFQEKDGRVTDGKLFVLGSGVLHDDEVSLLPAQRALVTLTTTGDSTSEEKSTCKVELFQWAPRSGMFVWNRRLTEERQSRECGGKAAAIR